MSIVENKNDKIAISELKQRPQGPFIWSCASGVPDLSGPLVLQNRLKAELEQGPRPTVRQMKWPCNAPLCR